MKNRNCPNKDICRDYNASRCEGCAIGEKIARLVRQKKKLKAENTELRARLDKAVGLPRVECIMTREWLNRETIGDIMFEWCVLYKKDGYTIAEPCLSKEAAEERLKELKENNND